MIDYRVGGDGVATLALDMADRPMNVLNDESTEAIGEAVRRAISDEAVSGAIVTSRKNDFMAGAGQIPGGGQAGGAGAQDADAQAALALFLARRRVHALSVVRNGAGG